MTKCGYTVVSHVLHQHALQQTATEFIEITDVVSELRSEPDSSDLDILVGRRRGAILFCCCKRHRSASHLADIPDHQDHLVGYPEVHRWRFVSQVDSQFRKEVVEKVNPDARENESGVTWRFAGRCLLHERTEFAGFLW